MSDYDLVVFVRHFDAARRPVDLSGLTEKYGVDIKPRLEVVKTSEPPSRKSGAKVASPAELVGKLKDAGVIG